jgi:alkanesulfonate monooxygenase SsuD/methylene tetrahydromethanopterin reductase-like flavin-dependent oxidoreductase (luciferase family)
MDHVTNGRIGWNIVTSYSTPAAKAFGYDTVVPHDEHYAAVEEYVKLCKSSNFPLQKYQFQSASTKHC